MYSIACISFFALPCERSLPLPLHIQLLDCPNISCPGLEKWHRFLATRLAELRAAAHRLRAHVVGGAVRGGGAYRSRTTIDIQSASGSALRDGPADTARPCAERHGSTANQSRAAAFSWGSGRWLGGKSRGTFRRLHVAHHALFPLALLQLPRRRRFVSGSGDSAAHRLTLNAHEGAVGGVVRCSTFFRPLGALGSSSVVRWPEQEGRIQARVRSDADSDFGNFIAGSRRRDESQRQGDDYKQTGQHGRVRRA